MKKYIRDGKVAILCSPGYGAGWSTWNDSEEETRQFLLFDPTLVQFVLDNQIQELVSYCKEKYPEVYTGGARQLEVNWLAPDTLFRIAEYDGSESIIINHGNYWDVA